MTAATVERERRAEGERPVPRWGIGRAARAVRLRAAPVAVD
ncbi:MAG: hypothetical protein KatS3mg102_0964 [Planctomycetota bacterium]|nr:MAG: hypothetical protein KatS3mg102_0964 [Planctomycetota bacterium]